MAKYRAKLYAKALAELVLQKKSPSDIKKMPDAFLDILKKNGDMAKAKEIAGIAESLILKESGKNHIILETARKIDKKLLKYFIKEGDKVSEKINPKIIAPLGRFSMNFFLPDAKISLAQGKIFWWQDRLIVPLYHPAAALRATAVKDALKIERIDDNEIEKEIREIVKSKPGMRANAYMGMLMAKHKGKIDTKKAMELINRVLG